MPMFHMEHCVFCAFLSSGKDYRDCGRPCDTHRVALRDRVGAELPLKADAGCRNTVFNNRAQTGAEYAAASSSSARAASASSSSPRRPTRSRARWNRYDGAAARRDVRGELWRELKLLNQLGVTRGQMETAPRVLLRKG
jgi:putative protease